MIDTEEHTAQLSHKDQRDAAWARTEQYEMRFQDLTRDDEKPVDIGSLVTLLDALYEEGVIPTYSFPKDVAISEYAPGAPSSWTGRRTSSAASAATRTVRATATARRSAT